MINDNNNGKSIDSILYDKYIALYIYNNDKSIYLYIEQYFLGW